VSGDKRNCPVRAIEAAAAVDVKWYSHRLLSFTPGFEPNRGWSGQQILDLGSPELIPQPK